MRFTYLLKSLLLIPTLFLFNTLCAQETICIISPREGAKLDNNMPTLAWKNVQCDYYEIWIDRIKMDSLSNERNSYVVFPLSFGEHHSKIVAVKKEKKTESPDVTFYVNDSTLSKIPKGSILLRDNWKVKSSIQVAGTGNILSSKYTDTRDWNSTSIPATVLTALVRNGIYPNPYIEFNNMRIPDSNDDYNKEYDLLKYSHIKGQNPWKKPYWYRTEFELKELLKGKLVWLNFNEINYRAEVWLNGKQIADTTAMVGMERHFKFDVSSRVKVGKNYLAVLIYPLDYVGKPAIEPLHPFSNPGTNMGDGMTGKNYTKWDVLGWDWQPAIRDRDMGVTEEVYLSFTDAIELDNLYLASDLLLPDTSRAYVSVSFDIKNLSDKPKNGTLKASFTLDNEIISIVQHFQLKPYENLPVMWDHKALEQLMLTNPKLWWPAGYGKANVYTFHLSAESKNGEKAELQSNFGIRKIETYIGAKEREFKINGRKIYLKGGNWVIDMMLNWSASRYLKEIELTRNANMNILRVWGPTGVPPQAFFEAADKLGILIWQDFLNDYWGTFRNTPGYQPEIKLFEKASTEIVQRYRNHPSLIMWCGGNEGVNPREDLLMKILKQYDDRDSKFYLKTSNDDGLHGGGPYNTILPKAYFTSPKLNGFNSEIGLCGLPVFTSVTYFMPDLGKSWEPGKYPIDGVWAYHDANDWPGSDSRKFTTFDNIIRNSYGAPDSTAIEGAKDYLAKCQLVNYDVDRAEIEAINRQLWTNSSGAIVWKSNSSWPSMVWQIYDWYLQANAGYYGFKKAAESLHIQLNRDVNKVSVLNATDKTIKQANVKAILMNSKLELLWTADDTSSLIANTVTNFDWIVPIKDELSFLKLTITDKQGKLLSDNFYWLSANDDLKELQKLSAPQLVITATTIKKNGKTLYHIQIKNIGPNISLMTALVIKDKESGLEILPTLWSDNYVNLLPGEAAMLTAEVRDKDILSPTVIECKPFNTKTPMTIIP